MADVLSASENLSSGENLGAEVDVAAIRARFSSLRQGFAFFDAPGGTQVPDEVGEAIARALRDASANLGAGYATSIRVGQILEEAEHKAARFLGCEPHEVIFGPNMTTLNFALSRTAARAFQPGDEILVSCLDHDAGVAPWLRDRARQGPGGPARRAARRHHARLRGPGEQARAAHQGGRVRLGVERGRHRRPTPGGCASSRTTPARSPGWTRCTTRRTSRSTSAPSAPTCSSARRTSSAARTSAWPPGGPR